MQKSKFPIKRALRLFCLLLVACVLSSCVKIDMPDPEPQTVYASFFPIYALAEGVCRDVPNLSLYCLTQPQAGCIRSYTLSDWDTALLSGADLLIIGGRGLESFEGTYASGGIAVLTAMDNMALIGSEEDVSDDSSHFEGPNPWLFLSVEGARSICSVIAAGMTELDPDFAPIYAANLAALQQEFDSLQEDMRAAAAGTDWPGAILMQEGLSYFAQEMGLSNTIEIVRETGSDLGDNELREALQQMEQSGYSLVLIERQAPQGLVSALREAGYTVCLIDVLTDHAASESHKAYFTAMRANIGALSAAVAQ